MAVLAMTALSSPSMVIAGPVRHDDEGIGSNWLTGVKALAPDDVWLVGNRPTARTLSPLVRHYDGATWTRVGNLEKPVGDSCLPSAVDALADDDVWVTCIDSTIGEPLVEHWDGSAWHLQEIPPTGEYTDLWHVWEDSPHDVWVVGRSSVGASRGLVDHFDGHTWEQMDVPVLPGTDLFGVSGTSPTDVWSVGHRGVRGLVLRWNGTAWIDIREATTRDVFLTGVAALSSNDVWVVGDRRRTPPRELAASHWDGEHWTSYPPNRPGSGDIALAAVSMATHSSVWVAGHWQRQSGWVRMYQYWDGSSWHLHTP